MLKVKSYSNAKKIIESEVIKTIQKQGCNLNSVNNNGENLLHVSAANSCYDIVKTILAQERNNHVINRKNKFGWTPLMQAIRNGDIETVKLLLEKKSNVDDSTYLGMSTLGLAAAISRNMFETVYNACPNALENTTNDDISPLCVAALKNDKELFFKLLELGVSLSTANEYTQLMMKNSTVPEIANLSKNRLTIEDYWDDISDNIKVLNEQEFNENENESLNTTENKLKYNRINIFTPSPTIYFTKTDILEKSNTPLKDKNTNKEITKEDLKKHSTSQEETTPIILQRLQTIRPADLEILEYADDFTDLNVTLGFTPEFSPLTSPYVPPDINDDNVFGKNTPTPPRCRTPPKGILLNPQQAKMVAIMKRFGLNQHIPIFIEQEVDMDLFLILTNDDLIEIGIEQEENRCALLTAIKKYKEDLKRSNIINSYL